MERLYLTLIRGYTKIQQTLGSRGVVEELKKTRDDIQSKIAHRGFNIDRQIKIGKKEYELGTIFYKEYLINNMPNDQELVIVLDSGVNSPW
jgi:hypothetical protein